MSRADVAARARALDEEPMEPHAFDRLVSQVLADDDEIQERAALIAWFVRRYPTARERLAYARRKYRQLVNSPLRVEESGATARARV